MFITLITNRQIILEKNTREIDRSNKTKILASANQVCEEKVKP